MRARAAVLCDAATVREGLLHVLGAGITRLWRDELPAPMSMSLAFFVEVEQELVGRLIEVGMLVQDPDGEKVAEARGAIEPPGSSRLEPGETLLLPMVLPLHQAGVGKYGRYSVEIKLNGQPQQESLVFWVLHPEEQAMPPL